MFKRTFGRRTLWRYATLVTHHISSLPIVFLEPHSACNCRCVMCDIWKSNSHLKQMQPEQLEVLLQSLRRLQTRQVVLTGGEPLLHPRLFDLCRQLKSLDLRITLLSTGLLLSRKSREIVEHCDDVIVSLDGDPQTHDRIRRVSGAFQKLSQGVRKIRTLNRELPILARCVIQKDNYRVWPRIITTARTLELSGISFLPADLFSEAFNHKPAWSAGERDTIAVPESELPALRAMVRRIRHEFAREIEAGFIRESPEKLQSIYDYYVATHGQAEFNPTPCHAPWVSAVIEPEGHVRPCFFLPAYETPERPEDLESVLNAPRNRTFREDLNTQSHPICRRCVCRIRLPPTVEPDPYSHSNA